MTKRPDAVRVLRCMLAIHDLGTRGDRKPTSRQIMSDLVKEGFTREEILAAIKKWTE